MNKRQIKKDKKWYFRRLKFSDKSNSFRTSVRIAYFEILKKQPFVVLASKRKNFRNVELITFDKDDCKRLVAFMNT